LLESGRHQAQQTCWILNWALQLVRQIVVKIEHGLA